MKKKSFFLVAIIIVFLVVPGSGNDHCYKIRDATTNVVYGKMANSKYRIIGVVTSRDYEKEVPKIFESKSESNIDQFGYIENEYRLHQNLPNPFNPTTTIRFFIPKESHVKLRIYDTSGALVTTLIDEFQTAGMHDIVFDARRLSSGVYFYRIEVGEFIQTKKLILLR